MSTPVNQNIDPAILQKIRPSDGFTVVNPEVLQKNRPAASVNQNIDPAILQKIRPVDAPSAANGSAPAAASKYLSREDVEGLEDSATDFNSPEKRAARVSSWLNE